MPIIVKTQRMLAWIHHSHVKTVSDQDWKWVVSFRQYVLKLRLPQTGLLFVCIFPLCVAWSYSYGVTLIYPESCFFTLTSFHNGKVLRD